MEVSAEVHFAQKLASNEKKIRDRAVKRLKKYLSVRSNQKSLGDADLIKIWKGLFYCMWMQDKPLIQEELSTRITNLLHSFPSTREALRFVKACLETFSREWHGIDRLRLDKFMMMLRDMLHETFSLLSKDGWQILECRAFASFVTQHVMDPKEPRLPDGLKLHLSDIFIDEINKVSLEELNSRKMVVLLQPFIHFIIHSNKTDVVRRIMSDTIHKVCNTMTNEAKLKKQTKQKTTDKKKKDEDDMSGDENEEEMDVDQGETETETSSFVFDMAPLFENLFKMAQEKNVRAPNRAVIYMLLKKYPEVFQNVTSKMESECADEEECDLNRNDLRLEKVDGKATDKQLEAAHTKKRRKRRQKNKNELQQVDSEHSSKLAVDSEMVEDEGFATQVKMKKQKKGKNVEHLQSSASDSSDTAKKKNATEVEDSIKKKRPRKKERVEKTEKDFVIGDNQDKTMSKKRKRLSADSVSPLIAKKKSKLSQSVNDSSADLMEDAIDTTPKIKKQKLKKSKQEKNDSVISHVESSPSEWSINSSAEKNTNSNARSKSKSRVMTNLVAPVELVVYPSDASTTLASGSSESGFVSEAITRTLSVKSKKKKGASSPAGQKLDIFRGHAGTGDMSEASTSSAFKEEEDMDIGTNSEESSSVPGRKGTRPRQDEKNSDVSFSLSTTTVYSPNLKKGHSRKAVPAGNGEDSGKGKVSDGTTSIVKEFCTVMSTPCSMVKKAIAMVTTNSDPGPDAHKKIQLAVADESMTPGQKKKVVFNLRKNKANKFKDYLKSLENQPDSPFQPSKSPSIGILKSPAPSPVVSKMDVDGASGGETGRSRKKKEALSRRRASAPGGIAMSNDNRLKQQRLSPSKGARSSQSPTGCKPRLKQRAKK